MKVGIIGCGKQSAKHLEALRNLGIDEIVVSDIRPEFANDLATHAGVSSLPIDDVFKDASVESIDICTPTPFHFHYAKRALRAGKHVFCERPLTTNVEEALFLHVLADRLNRVGMVAYGFKYHPSFVRAKEAIDTGLIGDLRAVYMRLGDKGSHRAWKHQSDNGGGAINEMMSHMLDLLLWLVGDITEVECVNLDTLISRRRIEGQGIYTDAEDFALVVGKGAAGTKFVVQSDLVSQSYKNRVEIIGTEGCIDLSIADSKDSFIFLNQAKFPFSQGRNSLACEPTDLLQAMYEDFLRCIRDKEKPRKNSFSDAPRLARLFQKIKKEETQPAMDPPVLPFRNGFGSDNYYSCRNREGLSRPLIDRNGRLYRG